MFSWKQHLEFRPNASNNSIWYFCLGNLISPQVSVVQTSHFSKREIQTTKPNRRFTLYILNSEKTGCIYLKHKDSAGGQAGRLWSPIHADSFLDRRSHLETCLDTWRKTRDSCADSKSLKFKKLGLVLFCWKVSRQERKRLVKLVMQSKEASYQYWER